ncbi:nuclear transport factor 2 family protein [Lysobacter zhanggongensis]|uniref:nuclear transport factor 2 family protein n=1 Tax=Lysobacter zhanggongensis TaxID=1774951 RepID=UPI00399CC06E
MSQEQELWRLEEQFWVGDAAFYERTLAPESFMVLPAPAGVLEPAATIESIRSASRWQNVSFIQKHYAASTADIVVLAYVVQADRGSGNSAYAAQCSSTYVRIGGNWRLALHHQTPAGQANEGRA